MSNYYKILELNNGASEDEIKKAYRRLAREHHPDKGGDKEHFQKIQQAYSALTNKESNENNINMADFNDDFMNIFNLHNNYYQHHQQQTKKPNHFYSVNVSLRDVYFGTKKKFNIKREISCNKCISKCNICGGEGVITKKFRIGPMIQMQQTFCNNCGGSGRRYDNNNKNDTDCNCNHGKIQEEKIVELDIERGIINGKQYIIEGWGENSTKINEVPGDFVITINIEDHPDFKRNKLDLIYDKRISLRQSITGGEIDIPHFDGSFKISLGGFGIINPKKTYTILKRGLINGNDTGDLHLRFHIDYPELNLDQEDIDKLNLLFDKMEM